MIPRRELEQLRAEWSLDLPVIEKDYVLGWLLSGIAQHPLLSRSWVFKGGTCLRKCYYETFRFSEDLDFTVIPEASSSWMSTRLRKSPNVAAVITRRVVRQCDLPDGRHAHTPGDHRDRWRGTRP